MPENAAPKHLMMAAENLCIAGATLPSVSNWRTATVADLVRGSMLSLHRRWSFVSPSRDGSTALAQACQLKLQLTSEPADGDASGGRAVLTARDLATRAAPSGSAGDRSEQLEEEIEVERGDVILTNIVSGPLVVRVADSCDAGALLGANLVLLRPHARHLDSEFLAGVLAAPSNLSQAVSDGKFVRLDVCRIRVPMPSLTVQQQYGLLFRMLRPAGGQCVVAGTGSHGGRR